MRISDWSSDVCSSDLPGGHKGESRDGEAATGFRRPVEHQLRLLRPPDRLRAPERQYEPHLPVARRGYRATAGPVGRGAADRAARPADHRPYERPHLARSPRPRSEEHTSELQSLMRISYAVFCLKQKKQFKK